MNFWRLSGRLFIITLVLFSLVIAGCQPAEAEPINTKPEGTDLSTETGELPIPGESTQQSEPPILDIDSDNLNENVDSLSVESEPINTKPERADLSTETGELPIPSESTQQSESLKLDIDSDNLNENVDGLSVESEPINTKPEWTHLTTTAGELPIPSESQQQTASLILDIDNDKVNDIVIATRQGPGVSLVWFKGSSDSWQRYVIDSEILSIEAGGAYHDIDRDGDLDIVMGGDYKSNKVWWWENPYPDFNSSGGWTRHTIKDFGSAKHHDQMFGDFDGNGQVELVFWNQGSQKLYLAEIPFSPRNIDSWPMNEIYSWSGKEHEGLAKADIDGDGLEDIVGGGGWFKYEGGTSFTHNVIDDDQRFTRAAAGQLISGGRPEVVFVKGDDVGWLRLYEWNGTDWVSRDLLSTTVDHGHSLQIVDIDQDGNLDVFNAEMRLNGGNPDAKMRIFYGDSSGNFPVSEVTGGFGNHESRVADLDGDGDPDILGKPYNWETPRLDIWINSGNSSRQIDRWCRRVIDSDRPWRSVFVTSVDIDGDNRMDIVSGGWWYKNPGSASGNWTRNTIGKPLNNFATVYDFDGDNDQDILGTTGQGQPNSDTFVWARNDGTGNFTILDNIERASGDFLQGVAVGRYQPTLGLEVALSWHASNEGIQMLSVPVDPSNDLWMWRLASDISQDEELSTGDIDGDNDIDLLLGTQWLRNQGTTFEAQKLSETPNDPDRNRLVDVNGDGRLDAVVGFEAISSPGKLAWYEQPLSPDPIWTEHIIANVIGPMSVDAVDMDRDGDIDVIVGEHNLADSSSARMLIYENMDGRGLSWSEHIVYTGDEHHDGAHVTDIDADGDYDIVSIGWSHGRVLLYENSEQPCDQTTDNSSATPSPISSTPLPQSAEPDISTKIDDQPILTPTPSFREVTDNRCRVDGLESLYTFQEGNGSIVHDVSETGTPLDLVVDLDEITWLPESGLEVHEATLITSMEPATDIIDAIKTTDELSVEVWIEPDGVDQFGPARILTLSTSPHSRNFTLGQGKLNSDPMDVFDVRLRTTDGSNNDNGEPSMTTESGTAEAKLTHVVYTRNNKGEAVIYVDGRTVHSSLVPGRLHNWDDSYHLGLANEIGGQRPWLGRFYKVAIYSCVLSELDVANQYAAGLNPDR